MRKEIKIFYSWQSDLDKNTNQYFLRDRIKESLKDLNCDLIVPIRLDHDTKGISGSPEIKETIFEKIASSDIFIADVSIINKDSEFRKTPNPNVLIELGYAITMVGWKQIILMYNEFYGNENDLPFDLRGRRLMKYIIEPSHQKNKIKKQQIKEKIDIALRASLFDLNSRQDEIKTKEKVELEVTFNEAVIDHNYNYECFLKMNLKFTNLTNANLNNLVFETNLNNQKVNRLSKKIDGVFYSGKPISLDKTLQIREIPEELNFEIRYATDEIPYNQKLYSIQIKRDHRIVTIGKGATSENYFKIIEMNA